MTITHCQTFNYLSSVCLFCDDIYKDTVSLVSENKTLIVLINSINRIAFWIYCIACALDLLLGKHNESVIETETLS